MKLIEDLGLRHIGSQGQKQRYGVYECPICGSNFECRVAHVKSGWTTKCRKCSNIVSNSVRAAKAASEFIEKAQAVHGDKYNYELVDYGGNNKLKVEFICNTCGAHFMQSPDNHLRGKGCPHCAKERSNIALRMSEKNDRPTILYYIYFPEVNLWKIGCTSTSIKERFRKDEIVYEVIRTKEYTFGYEAYRVEKLILDATKEFQFVGPKAILKGGDSELRTQSIDFAWEVIVS